MVTVVAFILRLIKMYRFFLKFLWLLPAELSHWLTLGLLRWIYCPSMTRRLVHQRPKCPVEIAGLQLPNPIGLAAGLDKDGRCLDAWFALGFGFIEVGTVTPKPQVGNPKPRLFRLKKFKAFINRMGFNNKGIDALVYKLKHRKFQGIVGVNIGKNRGTPLDKAVEDYRLCLQKVYVYADYVTVNISSPNTPDLRKLQSEQYLNDLLRVLMLTRQVMQKKYQRYVPLFVKIDPDLDTLALSSALNIFLKYRIDGIIVANTSLMRESIQSDRYATEAGGLSGDPIYNKTKSMVTACFRRLGNRLPIIAVGGINSPERAEEMLSLGASALQIYSAFIYQGPSIIKRIINYLKRK